MREIEFRGKDFYNKWHYGSLLVDTYYEADLKDLKQPKEIKVCQIRYKDGWSNKPKQVEVDCNTICEYSGLKDKNGNEIFEGDFVKGTISSAWNKEEIICEVRFEDDGYYCVETRQGYEYKHKLRFSKKLEVVGNVFDNPNLIKGEK